MEQKPIISAIVPVYNAEKYLRNCLNRFLAQTFSQWEVILVDDGSRDGSGKICDEYAEKDPRFRVIHKENEGVSVARNVGIEASKGDYLMFVDADDWCTRTCMEKMVNAMETYRPDLVICGYDRFRDDWSEEHLITRYSITLMKNVRQFLHLYAEARINLFGISVWAKLYPAETIRANNIRFNPKISYEEDGLFNADYVPYIRSVAVIGESLYRYRQQDESLSKGYRKGTYPFLVNGLRRRKRLMTENHAEWNIPDLNKVFMIAVKSACRKVEWSDLKRKEKRQEYREIVSYPETKEAGEAARQSGSRVTRWIAFAVRHQNPHLLSCVMRLWKLSDDAVHFRRDAAAKLKKAVKKIKK